MGIRRVRPPGPTVDRTSRPTTSGIGNRATGPPPTRPSPPPTSPCQRGHLHPPHPRRLDRDVRLRRELGPGPRPADAAHDIAGAARHPHRHCARAGAQACHTSRTSGSRPTTSVAGSAARCRSIRATSSRSSSILTRQAGQVDRGSIGKPAGRLFAATTTSMPSSRRRRMARSPA